MSKRLTNGDRDRLMQLCTDLTKWNLGTLIVLALAFGGGLWRTNTRVEAINHKLNYILALALGIPESPNAKPDPGPHRQIRSSAAQAAGTFEVTFTSGPGVSQAGGSGRTTRTEFCYALTQPTRSTVWR